MSEDHDRLEAMHEAAKARQKAKEHAEFLEVLEICVGAIMTARMAIYRQFDTQRAMEELSVARFQADAVLAKYGRGRLASKTNARTRDEQ